MNSPLPIAWERVHHVSNYYDVPLEGLADLAGVPHMFFYHEEIVRRPVVDNPLSSPEGAMLLSDQAVSGLEEIDDDADIQIDWIYSLVPLPSDLVAKSQEGHAIFERWHQAWSQDHDQMKHHPALPEDKDRYAEISTSLKTWLDDHRRDSNILKHGQFECDRLEVAPGSSRWTHFQVLWSDVKNPS
jgi:hypothetical protein